MLAGRHQDTHQLDARAVEQGAPGIEIRLAPIARNLVKEIKLCFRLLEHVIRVLQQFVEHDSVNPTIEFESGLEESVQWYVDNQAWWTAVFERKGELQTNWT